MPDTDQSANKGPLGLSLLLIEAALEARAQDEADIARRLADLAERVRRRTEAARAKHLH